MDAAPALLVDNIGHLVTNDPALGRGRLGVLTDAAIVVQDGRVAWVGAASEARGNPADGRTDAGGRAVVPGFVESHSHLVFAGERAEEFAARMAGQAYAAGGIRTTLAHTRAASDAQLTANVDRLVAEYLAQGTTTVECKSGYGQTVRDEERSVRIAAGHADEATLLAAHVLPPEFAGRPDDYVAMVIDEMIPACAPHARWIDVFCERDAFDEDQSRAVLSTGKAAGLGVRVHGNQLTQGPGVRLAVELDAASVDHVCHTDAADIEALASSDTVATLLPGADFSTRNRYPDARALLDAGVTVALGADCNPGTSYTTSLPFCIAVAVRDLGMTPDEALWSATAGGARALRRDDVGVLRPGASADLALLDAPTHLHLAYRPGVPLVRAAMKEGRWHGRP
ncbi:imidazolonepropionase [Nigerium massiliense]|uniref:imidazolonepropionase n=1 Tax=Nigerium massiliense TaxID=1522317 RepID=UPI00058DFAE1|nr:imidazolonepropionase [Nigerium massiliense]